ncbi:MAG: ribosome silencing factor [Beijerinckiaceae bacterium]
MPLEEAAVRPLHPAAGAQALAADSAKLVMDSLEEMKAETTVEIDLAAKSSIADSMIITTGRSNRHVAAIAEKVMEDLKAHGRANVRVEGMPNCDWVLIDAGDVIVHVFRPEVRAFYNLEKLWGEDRPGERRAG